MRNILMTSASLALAACIALALYMGALQVSAPKPIQPHTVKVCSMQEDGQLIDCTTGKALDYVRAPGAKMGEWK